LLPCSLGIAEGALGSILLAYFPKEAFTNSIKQFSSFQGISFKLADMATQVEASKIIDLQSV